MRSTKFWEHRRKKHLLTGLLHCHQCGSPLTATGKDYLACGNARRKGICDNRRGIRRQQIEEAVLDSLKNNLMQPDLVKEFIQAFHKEANKHTQTLNQNSAQHKRDLTKVTKQLDGFYEAIADGLRTPGLLDKMKDLEAQQAVLQKTVNTAPPPPPTLHPNLAELYKRKVEALHASLNNPDTRTEAAEILRSIIERITVRPLERGIFEIELIGEIANMVNLAQNAAKPKTAASKEATALGGYRGSVKVVAGVGFEPTTFRL